LSLKKTLEKLKSYTRRERMVEYEEERRRVNEILSKPSIAIRVELPPGFEDMREEFMSLEHDEAFLSAVVDLVKKTLLMKKLKR